MSRTLMSLTLVVAMAAATASAASPEEEARVYLDKATAAYALSKYSVAAENFEKAFELKPDPALLYNAAQAHRLAGNKQRALELYESYLRVYGKNVVGAEQIETRIRELKQAIERDKTVATSPPTGTLPVGRAATEPPAPPGAATPTAPPTTAAPAQAPPAALPGAPPPADTTSNNPTMLTQPGSAPAGDKPITHKPLFWVGVGGAVVVATVIVLLLASGGNDPAQPSLGRVPGN